ncbi:MAG: pyruvate kinase [Clostridia bacterium]|nr:pyruvate kinase [Clostridia bacterium]
MVRRTKIVCTLGPSSEDVGTLSKMIRSGMDIARLNFSHGTREDHLKRLKALRRAAETENKFVAVMLDIKGPKIRVGRLKGESIYLKDSQRVSLITKASSTFSEQIPINYENLSRELKPGDRVLLNDGRIVLKVEDVDEEEIRCTVLSGGELKSNQGVNIPGVELSMPAVTEKDYNDILWGIENGVNFIAASFVSGPRDILEIRKILEEKDCENIHIIAKIESQAGVNNIEHILAVSDGIMVARGDLGVEIPSEEVPLIQKELIKKCNGAGKPVITATHMLDSMVRNPRPTMAETSDVANAIFDGSDAIMLSGETAVGKYPVEAVSTMAKLARKAEEALQYEEILLRRQKAPQNTITEAISHASCTIAMDLKADAILTPTATGSTARLVSKYRPKAPIIALSPNRDTLFHLCLVWGVYPVEMPRYNGTDEMFEAGVKAAVKKGLLEEGDLVVLTAGVPMGVSGTTNLIKVHVVGEALVKGNPIGNQVVRGRARVAVNAAEAQKIKKGEILVAPYTDKGFMPAIEKASAIIVEQGGVSSHAVIVGLNFNIPVIVGAKKACELIKNGELITVDGVRGLIYRGKTNVV